MPLESKSKSISGVDYHVTTLGAIEGRKVYVQLMKALAPGLKSSKTEDFLSNVLMNLDEAVVVDLSDRFARVTTVDVGGALRPCLKDIFDLHFAGKYSEMTQWLMFCLEVNFGDFLGAALQKMSAPDGIIPVGLTPSA